jgi:hypothetical protein
MAAKAPFSLAGFKLLVSLDCMVADAVQQNRSPRGNWLLTGKITGNFLVFGSFERDAAIRKPLLPAGFSRQTPKTLIREILLR